LRAAGIVLALLALGYLGFRAWPEQPVGDLWPRAWPAGDTEEEGERERHLEAWREALFRRIEGKRQIAEELIAGRLTLREGVARLRELRRLTPNVLEDVDRTVPGESDEERGCRQLIALARALLKEQPEKALEVSQRLEAERQGWMLAGNQAPEPRGRRHCQECHFDSKAVLACSTASH
jgi:hypothetical protein